MADPGRLPSALDFERLERLLEQVAAELVRVREANERVSPRPAAPALPPSTPPAPDPE